MSRTALVLDDSSSMRMVARRMLEPLGFSVVEAQNAAAAIRILEERSGLDLMLVDWRMEGMDGFQFVSIVRADPRFASSRIVMVTVENQSDKVRSAARAGVDAYILKPYDKALLAARLKSLGLLDTEAAPGKA